MTVFVLYLKYVREPIGIYDSNERIEEAINLLISKYPNSFSHQSFIIKEFELNKTQTLIELF